VQALYSEDDAEAARRSPGETSAYQQGMWISTGNARDLCSAQCCADGLRLVMLSR